MAARVPPGALLCCMVISTLLLTVSAGYTRWSSYVPAPVGRPCEAAAREGRGTRNRADLGARAHCYENSTAKQKFSELVTMQGAGRLCSAAAAAASKVIPSISLLIS
jgi:hypothetical protein